MDDQTFLSAFEAGTLDLEAFDHRAHVRMAWLYLRQYGWEQGTAKIRAGLYYMVSVHGHAQKYHETITLFWAHLVQHAVHTVPDTADFEGLMARFPALADARLIHTYYSAALLHGDTARRAWVEPDLQPLPDSTRYNQGG